MKTPVNLLLTVLGYWVAIFSVLIVPKFIRNYPFNLAWMTLVIPNVLRYIIGNVPQLAVDRRFFFSTTIISFLLTYFANKIWKQTKDSVTEYEGDKRKAFNLSALLMTNFVIGALITYYVGIDTSIYSNMGWESVNQCLTT